MNDEITQRLELPAFTPGGILRETPHFKIVMDWKLGMERQPGGERFFIEPKDEGALRMLQLAARVHRINNFNNRTVQTSQGEKEFPSLRANFSMENLPTLLLGVVEIPEDDEDTIPSPDRMEGCLRLHPDEYTFSDNN
ncbi:hypothetical protein HY386_01310 [Candidatus Daviesbacteria bacterium]|nr:hypothetical protein [Candidatus Daviesbacteria bacterium]